MAKKSKLDNLVTRHLTTEEATEMGSKGGKASVEARRKRKTQREQFELLLSLPLKSPKAVEQIKKMGINDEDIDNQMAMNVSLFNVVLKGGKGAVQAYNTITEILGDLDKYKLQIKKANEEITKLKLEQEKLKRELKQQEKNEDGMLGDILNYMEQNKTNG